MSRILIASLLLVGCAPPTDLENTNPGLLLGRPVDVTSRRVLSAAGDRVEVAARVPHAAPHAGAVGGWNYDVQGPINGGPALFTASFSAGNCSDMLYVPINTDSVPNLYAFTNLYNNCPQGVDRFSPARCDTTLGHCPTVAWLDLLAGRFDGNAAVTSFDGSELYVTTTAGRAYALRTSAGQIDANFDANNDLGVSDATFVDNAPWVDYPTGNLYVAVSYGANKKSALYKFDSKGNKLAMIKLPAGIASTPIYYLGYVYLATLDGRVAKLVDQGSTFTAVDAPWPLTLQSNQPIVSVPSIDADNNLIFATAGDRLGMATLAGDIKAMLKISAVPGMTTTPSSSTLDLTSHALFVGHEGKLWRVPYTTTGFGSATSTLTRGTGLGNEDPRSSPLLLEASPTQRFVFIGDGGGFLNRFAADALTNRAVFPSGAASTGIGGPIDGSIFVDYLGGNLYFGGGTGATKVYQVTQVGLN